MINKIGIGLLVVSCVVVSFLVVICYIGDISPYVPYIFINKEKSTSSSKKPPRIQYTSSFPWIRSSYLDVMVNHHQILGYISALQSTNKLSRNPKILINFDSHADVEANNDHIEKGENNEGNWVNRLMSEGIIDEFYWVLPESTMVNAEQKNYYWDDGTSKSGRNVFRNDRTHFTVYRNRADNKLAFYPSDKYTGDYSQIQFTKTLPKDLPNFKNSAKEIILSIDADFFANQEPYEVRIKSEEELNTRINAFLKTIEDKEIVPTYVACSVSPTYLAGFQYNLEVFFNKLKGQSANP